MALYSYIVSGFTVIYIFLGVSALYFYYALNIV